MDTVRPEIILRKSTDSFVPGVGASPAAAVHIAWPAAMKSA
jgi:hypothetical protein